MAERVGLFRIERKRVASLAALVTMAAATLVLAHPAVSAADVTSVTGSAFGVSAPNVVTVGTVYGPYGPRPTATLPPGGSGVAVTGHDPSESVVFGPVTLFESGPVDVSTQGTTGASGSVGSTSTISAISTANGGQFSATSLSATCSANQGGKSGSTTVVNGVVDTRTEQNDVVVATQAIPTNPSPNYTVQGVLVLSPTDTETFTDVFNEQTVNPDGSITVTALHEILHGPSATGDLYVGRVVCGVTATVSTGGRYTPLTPARILDTRNGTGGFSSPIGPGGTIDLQVTGQGGVPASGVSAVAMNVTVTNPTAQSFLTLYPTGQTRPLAANLNFVAGQTVPNLVVVKVGAGGKVSIFNNAGTADVIADVAGWFSNPSAGNDGRYQPLTPARILDTRDGTGGGVRLNAGQSFDMQVSGAGGVPATGVEAVAMNVAVTNTTAQSFLTAYPTGETRPNAANLNWVPGLTVSNRVMVKVGAGGKVTLYNNAGGTDVIVDVNGYYTDASVAGTSGTYTPLTPARILDTRDGTGGISGPVGPGATIDVQVAGQGGVPAFGVSAVILNATVTQPTAASFFTIFPSGTARPLAADLNFAAGESRPNLVVVKVGANGKVSLYNQAGSAHVVFDVAGWFNS